MKKRKLGSLGSAGALVAAVLVGATPSWTPSAAAATLPLPVVNVDPANTTVPQPVTLNYRGLRSDEEPVNGLQNPYRGYRLLTEYFAKDLRDPFDHQQRTRSWNGYDKTDPANFTDWHQPADASLALPQMESVYKAPESNATQLYFYLGDYVCKSANTTCDGNLLRDIDAAGLANVETTLQRLRSIGYSVVLRFAYDTDHNEHKYTIAQIKRHIDQLAPIVARNVDVISTWQIGFLGAWGEWGTNSTGCHNSNLWCANDLVTYFVNKLPTGITTTIRTIAARNTVTDPAIRAKVGFNDDGFLSDCCEVSVQDSTVKAATRDTYQECEVFWNSTQLGNTDPYASDTIIDPMEAIRRAQTFHCTTWNRNHDPLSQNRHYRSTVLEPRPTNGIRMTSTTIPTSSSTQPVRYQGNPDAVVGYSPDYFLNAAGTPVTRTAYEFLRDHMGYRIQLDRADLTPGKGTTLPVHLELRNFGFSAPDRAATAQLVLLNSSGTVVRRVSTTADWRKWYGANEAQYTGANGNPPTHAVDGTVDLAGLPSGSYRLGLHFTPANSLAAYQYRLANGGAFSWDGQNNLFAEINLGPQPAPVANAEPVVSGSAHVVRSVKSTKLVDDPNLSLAAGTQLIQWAANGAANQSWIMAKADATTYTLRNSWSRMCVAVAGGSTADGAAVVQAPCDSSAAQRWTISASGTGYALKAAVIGKCLDVYGGATTDAAKLIQWTCHGGTNQQWTFS